MVKVEFCDWCALEGKAVVATGSYPSLTKGKRFHVCDKLSCNNACYIVAIQKNGQSILEPVAKLSSMQEAKAYLKLMEKDEIPMVVRGYK